MRDALALTHPRSSAKPRQIKIGRVAFDLRVYNVSPSPMTILRGRVRWMLIAWMLVISAVSYLDRVNISIAGPSIEREFHLDHIHLGWVFSAWVLGYALFQAPSGRLADRFGPRKILTLGTLWWAVFTALTALTPPNVAGALAILLIVRFALGVGESVVYPASNRLVAAWIPSPERGLANGLIFAGVGTGAAVTPPLIAYVIFYYGWRSSLWICAAVGLVVGGLWFVTGSGQSSAASVGEPGGGCAYCERLAAGNEKCREQSSAAVANHLYQQERLGDHRELFCLWICRLHLLYVVLHLPEHGARLESEVERGIRHASFCRHGYRLCARRLGE